MTFSKTGMGKYISHLDLLRCFTRAIQRSGLPVVYSQGFNPHQKMTFSLPLPIGVTSGCETVDIQFEDGVSDEDIKNRLNENIPIDMRIIKVGEPVCKASEIAAAEYIISAATEEEVTESKLKSFFDRAEIPVIKKSKKKGEVTVNLPDYIKGWEVNEAGAKGFSLRVILDAGGERNLKPDILTDEIEKYLMPVSAEDWQIHRNCVFKKNTDGTLEIFE